MSEIKHYINNNRGSFYCDKGGKKLAEMTYVMAGDDQMIIEHTEVDESLKGQGVGKQLLEHLVEYVRENNIRVFPLCPFAKATFQKMKEWQDVLN